MASARSVFDSYLALVKRTAGAEEARLFVPPTRDEAREPAYVVAAKNPTADDEDTLKSWWRHALDHVPPPPTSSNEHHGGGLRLEDENGDIWWVEPIREELIGSTPDNLRRADDHNKETSALAWLALRPRRGDHLDSIIDGGDSLGDSSPWSKLLKHCAALVLAENSNTKSLEDATTGAAHRGAMHNALDHVLAANPLSQSGVSLLLIRPDGYSGINRRIGRPAADVLLKQVADQLRGGLRKIDTLFRFGGATFGVVLPSGEAAVRTLAVKLQARGQTANYPLAGAPLTFSAGTASVTPGETLSAGELIHRAHRALQMATALGGTHLVAWEPAFERDPEDVFDRMSSIFTGDAARDYRNMAVLWETLEVLNNKRRVDEIASGTVETLFTLLHADRVLLVDCSQARPVLLHGVERVTSAEVTQASREVREVQQVEYEMALAATSSRQTHSRRLDNSKGDHTAWAIPIVREDLRSGCLVLVGSAEHLLFDDNDSRFLGAVLCQLALALDRADLAIREEERLELERHQLREEIGELRRVVDRARLIHNSPRMQALVQTVHRVASSDATVLITGPSGTGKELIARTLHELSSRRGGPWVVVDCGAIAPSLIESELYGHVRGAFTGAGTDRLGRLAEADGGTLLLDEIAELPLEVQSKLLRFVQERQLVAVGASRRRQVDVRILAATNRNLPAEVAAGRFREDLYYRLNVIELEVPPLCEREDEVLLLARHFLQVFAVQYQRNIRRFSAAAEHEMRLHSWPGNVRELQNRVLKAVLLAPSPVLEPADLGLPAHAAERPPAAAPAAGPPAEHAGIGMSGFPANGERAVSAPEPVDSACEAAPLGDLLREQVQSALKRPFPLRRLISEELIAVAQSESGGVLRQAAQLAGLPESTFRRRLLASGDYTDYETDIRHSDQWRTLQRRLTSALRNGSLGPQPVDEIEAMLLTEIMAQRPPSRLVASRIFDVSLPTLRHRIADLENTQ